MAATSTEKFHSDLAEVMAEVGYVQKDGTNSHFKYKYASAEAVLKKLNAALSQRKIALGSTVELLNYEAGNAIVRITLTLMRGTDFLQVSGLGQGQDKGDKAVMKANTAALKYAVANAFLISWGDDPEADASTDSPAPKKAKKTEVRTLPTDEARDLGEAIQKATTEKALEKIKPDIVALKADDPAAYKVLVKEFKDRQKTLKEAA